MPQDMGQWGSANWAGNYGSVASPAAPAPSQNATPGTTALAAGGGGGFTPGGGGGEGGWANQSNDTPWTGSTVQTADGPSWVGPEPSWTSSFDDGGVVGGGQLDPDAAISTVQKALAAGRQSMGIPASLFGEAGTDADGDNDGDQDSAIAGNVPQRPAAPGGEGPDQNPFPTKTPAIPFGKRMGAVDTGEQIAGNIPARPAGPGGEGEDDNPFDTKAPTPPFGKRKLVPSAAQGGVIDEGDTDNPSSAGPPPQPTTNQPTGSGAGQVNMQALKQYAMGAGAMPADQAAALEQKIDPQGTMDPAQRKLLAVQAAGDPQAQFGLLQHFRQKYNLLSAYARAAAQGSDGRPADLAESTQAATKAFHNVPTGHSVSFQPAGNGVAVSVKKLGGGKQQQGLDGGGVVNPTDDTETPGEPPGIQDTGVEQMLEGAPSGDAAATGHLFSSIANAAMSVPQYLRFLTDYNFDKVADTGADKAVREAAKTSDNQEAAKTFSQPDPGVIPTGAGGGGGGLPDGATMETNPRNGKPYGVLEGGQGGVAPGHRLLFAVNPDDSAGQGVAPGAAQQLDPNRAALGIGSGQLPQRGGAPVQYTPAQQQDTGLPNSINVVRGGQSQSVPLPGRNGGGRTPRGNPSLTGFDPDVIDMAADLYGFGSNNFRTFLIQAQSSRSKQINALQIEQARADANAKLWGSKNDAANYRAQLRTAVMTDNSKRGVMARAQYTQMMAVSREIDTLRNNGVKDGDPRIMPLLQQQNILMGTLSRAGALEGQTQQGQAPQQQGGQQPLTVGTVIKGYRFNGGNPSDQTSWTKVQ